VSTSPSGSPRAGRRERARAAYQPSLTERYRTPIVAIAAIAGVVLISAFVFASAAAPAYACTQEWVPQATASPAPDASPNPGYVQSDLGNRHLGNGEKATYTYCPPASGAHYNDPPLGPITPRVYGPGDQAQPQGWIHNLEHGGLVVLYSCADGCPPESDLNALRALTSSLPDSPVCGLAPGQVGPVIARFDQMDQRFAAMVWARVLYQDTLDTAEMVEFFATEAEQTNPEELCARPSPSPSASPAASPSASPTASPSPAPS
jgi:hypothetical protein